MKRKNTYDIILFAILMALLFLPMLQAHFLHIPLKPLNGVAIETERPKFDFDSYRSGTYAKQEEAYLSQHFGFREPVVRLYNQYLWDCYKKTYAHDVVAGKNGWLYYPQSVEDYYGTVLYHWHHSANEARQFLQNEIKYLDWVRTLLKENGIELMVFIAPEKGFLYPEYLPERQYDTSSFNAREYFDEQLTALDFPHIEMTRWFQQMKDTANHLLIPQTGGHWNFSSVYAADSLFRYMETLKGIRLPQIEIGKLHTSDKYAYEAETDLEQTLNLARPIRLRQPMAPEAEVGIKSDTSCSKPKALFIGNSFFWRIAHYIPLEQVFGDVEFWYYYSTAYFGEGLSKTEKVLKYNLLEKLLDFDYVVWFTTGNQLYKGTLGFAENALVALTVGDSLMMAYARPIADTIRPDTLPDGTPKSALWMASNYIKHHPEVIPELRGDSLPALRNDEIPYARHTKDIRKDSLWMQAIEAQAFLRSATMKTMLHAEVDRLQAGKPLYRDQQAEIQFSLHCQQETKALMERMRGNPETMEKVKEKAEKYGKTLDKALEDDAIWLIRQKYRLDQCRLIDDPEAKIPLPPDFLSE